MSTVEAQPFAVPGARSDRPAVKQWLAVVAVALGVFSVVTAEQLPVGLLTSVGSALEVSEGTAGLMVTVPGLVAAVAALLVPVVAGSLDRRVMLVGLIILMGAASMLSAVAPNFEVRLASRVLIGLSIGGFWSIAGQLAVRLVPERSVPRATSLIFGGVAAAAVFGVPAGTLLGELGGWRSAFAVLGGLGLLVLIALLVLLPSLPASKPVTPRAIAAQLRNPAVRAGVFATMLIVTGQFVAFTFVSPILQQIAGFDQSLISSLLLAFGVAGIVGNFLAGAAVGGHVRGTVLLITVALASTMALFPLLGAGPAGAIGLLIAWGLAFGGVSVTLQTWMLKAAPEATEAASALWVSAFNLSIAIGALAGGLMANAVSLQGVLWLSGALVLLTALTVRRPRRDGAAGRYRAPKVTA